MFKLPDKPAIKEYDRKPDGRKYCVVPYRAALDKSLTKTELMHLLVLASYSANNGFSYVGITTLAKDHKCSMQNVAKYIKRLERKGYVKTHRKGVNGIRGCLRQIIFDASLSPQDIVAISNEPIPSKPIQYESDDDMKRRGRPAKQNTTDYKVEVTLSYDEGMSIVLNLIKSENDLLKLERLISQGITKSALLSAFS